MSRGRKKETVGRITKRDGESMKAIAQTGVITKKNIHKYFNLNQNRIELLKRNNFIVEHTVYIKGNVQSYYTLGQKGYTFIKNETDIEYIYKSNSHQISHDLKLNQIYCQCSELERSCWVNETELIHKWSQFVPKKERVASLDAIVSIDGTVIGIEVITNNYGEQELQEKQEAAEAIGCERIMIVNA